MSRSRLLCLSGTSGGSSPSLTSDVMRPDAMTQKDLFAALGAPLANPRWSWGAVRPDGVVFLRVWQDHVERRKGNVLVKIAFRATPKEDHEGDSLGHRERLQHVERIKEGATTFLIMCQAEDVTAAPRKVKDFEHENVFRGGRLRKIAGECWIELGARIPVRDVTNPTVRPAA